MFYALEDAKSILSIYQGLGQLNDINGEIFKVGGDFVKKSVGEFVSANGLNELPDLRDIDIIAEQADTLDADVRGARSSFEDFLGLVKTFSTDQFGSIYCEREWRALTPFQFTNDDVAMVVIPRRVGKTAYFQRFCQSVAPALHLPATLPIVPWEDLIEH